MLQVTFAGADLYGLWVSDSHTKRPITERPITKHPITKRPITKNPNH